jgi:hypothetical protein
MVVVRWPGKTRGAMGFACPFFWFFFLGKQKKRTKKLAEGIRKRLCNSTTQCVKSIAKEPQRFSQRIAEKREVALYFVTRFENKKKEL